MRPSPSPIPSWRGKMTEEGTVPHQECQGGRGSPQRPGRCSVLGVELGGGSQIGPGPCHIHMRPHVSMSYPCTFTCVHSLSTPVHTCPHASTWVHMCPCVCLTIRFKERFESLFIPYRNLTPLTSSFRAEETTSGPTSHLREVAIIAVFPRGSSELGASRKRRQRACSLSSSVSPFEQGAVWA